VETVEMHHAGRGTGDRRLDEESGQRCVAVRHLDALDRFAPQLQAALVQVDAASIGDQAARVLVARPALRHEVIEPRAPVLAGGGWFFCASTSASRSTRSATLIQLSNQAVCAAGSFFFAAISRSGRQASSTSPITPPRDSAPMTARLHG